MRALEPLVHDDLLRVAVQHHEGEVGGGQHHELQGLGASGEIQAIEVERDGFVLSHDGVRVSEWWSGEGVCV